MLKNITPMSITDDEERRYESETICYLCNKNIDDMSDKVHNRDHLTGKFLGASHNALRS